VIPCIDGDVALFLHLQVASPDLLDVLIWRKMCIDFSTFGCIWRVMVVLLPFCILNLRWMDVLLGIVLLSLKLVVFF
jgi:hypothetical protein